MTNGIVRRGNRFGVRVYLGEGRYKWLGTFATEDEALQAKLDYKRAPAFGTESCEQFADRYLDDFNRTTRSGAPRWGKKSVLDMGTSLRAFKKAFGPRPLRDLTTPEVRAWAATQPHKYVAVARTLMADAVLDGLAPTNPFSNLRLERSRGRKDIVVLTEPEIEKLCELAISSWAEFGTTFAAMIATAAYTGIRPGELFALTPADIRIDSCELDVRRSYNGVELKKPKNGRERLGIVLPPQAGQRIAAMPRKLTGEWLFESPKGGIFSKSTLDFYWRPVRVAFGRRDFPWYGMRHCAATLLLERGASVEDVAWQLGHTDGGRLVAELYGHPSDSGRRERLKRAFMQNVAELRSVESEAADG